MNHISSFLLVNSQGWWIVPLCWLPLARAECFISLLQSKTACLALINKKNIYKLNEKLISKQTKNSFKTNAKGYKLCQQYHIRKGIHFFSACQAQPWGFRIWLTDTGALGWRANDSNRKWADHYLRPIWAVFKHSLNDGWWGTHFCSTAKQRSFVHLMSGGQG